MSKSAKQFAQPWKRDPELLRSLLGEVRPRGSRKPASFRLRAFSEDAFTTSGAAKRALAKYKKRKYRGRGTHETLPAEKVFTFPVSFYRNAQGELGKSGRVSREGFTFEGRELMKMVPKQPARFSASRADWYDLLNKSELAGGSAWFTDSMIDVYLDRLEQRNLATFDRRNTPAIKFTYISVAQITMLQSSKLRDSPANQLLARRLFESQVFVCVLNVDGNHWILLEAVPARMEIYVYDSLRGRREKEAAVFAGIVSQLYNLVGQQVMFRSDWAINVVRGAKQENGNDCGPHSLALASLISAGYGIPVMGESKAEVKVRARMIRYVVTGAVLLPSADKFTF